VLNHTPQVRQLEVLLDQYETFAVTLVDKSRSRLFRFELGELIEYAEVNDAVPRRHDQGGWSAANIQRHADDVAHKHLKRTADVLLEELQARPLDHVIVGGPHEVVVEFESVLHPYVRDKVAATVSVSVAASTADVRQAAFEVEEQVERRKEAKVVARLRDAVGSGDRGVAGLEATLSALVERRVETLLVSDGYEVPGWRCQACQHMAARGRACPVCASPMELVDDVIEEAIEDAIGQKCAVAMVRGNADLDVLGRVGALLRF
jgi:peptide chain release factor subunit 1